jgi:hypothetical protein
MVRLRLPLGFALAVAGFVPGLLAGATARVISVKDESATAGWDDDQIGKAGFRRSSDRCDGDGRGDEEGDQAHGGY